MFSSSVQQLLSEKKKIGNKRYWETIRGLKSLVKIQLLVINLGKQSVVCLPATTAQLSNLAGQTHV